MAHAENRRDPSTLDSSALAWLHGAARVGPLIGPTPDGAPLVVEIPCRNSDLQGNATTHPVTVRADWSIDTGHDLEAERIAVAMGGQSTCLSLSTFGPSALAAGVHFRTRRILCPAQRVMGTPRWTLPGPDRRLRFGTAAEAAAHCRSSEHLARWFGCDEESIALILEAIEDCQRGVWDVWRHRDAVATMVEGGEAGVDEAWQAGLHPGFIWSARHVLGMGGSDFPPAFYIALAYRRPSLAYLRRLIEIEAPVDVIAWAAETERSEDRRDPSIRSRLIEMGCSLQSLRTLYAHWYRLDDINTLASGRQQPPLKAAMGLARWVTVGFTPSAEQLLALDRDTGTRAEPPTVEDRDAYCEFGSDVDGFYGKDSSKRTRLGLEMVRQRALRTRS